MVYSILRKHKLSNDYWYILKISVFMEKNSGKILTLNKILNIYKYKKNSKLKCISVK